ncbi:hypothetical protein ABEW13_04335 [Bacillus subtilis]
MGMYTGLRFKGIIKKEFAELIRKLMYEGLTWFDLSACYPQYDFLHTFSEIPRADFIPCGVLSYMPTSWEEDSSDGFDRRFDQDSRLWSFQCSLKNYNEEIEKFFQIIVPEIVEKSIHIEYYYEEMTRSIFYELKDGKVVESDREGIFYN